MTRRPFATTPRFLWLLCALALLINCVAAAPAVAKEDESPSSKTIAPVKDTGDFADLLDFAADTAPPVPSRIPTKAETASQIQIYKTQPLTLAHGVENVLTQIGLESYANVILDSLCLLAYAYLLRLTSRSNRYLMELIQFLGFFLFPALPFIQLANNALRTLSSALHEGGNGIRHMLACLTGHYATARVASTAPLSPINEKVDLYSDPLAPTTLIRQRLTHIPPHELEAVPAQKLYVLRRLGGVLLSLLTIIASITTLHIHLDHPVRSDWDSLGIASDQRHGWLSGGATTASLLSLLALLSNRTWSIKPEFTRPETRGGVFSETEVFVELAAAAIFQDVSAGFSGADSFAAKMADATANRYGLVSLLIFVAILNKRLACVPQMVFGGRGKGRRNSGQVARPAVVVAAVGVCVVVGGYHVLRQVVAMQVARANRAVQAVSGSGSLSSKLEGVE